MKYKVRTIEHAFAYVLDCNLATVEHLAMLKRPSKSELERQITIAQSMVDWAKDFGVDLKGNRAEDIVENGITVAQWVERMRRVD